MLCEREAVALARQAPIQAAASRRGCRSLRFRCGGQMNMGHSADTAGGRGRGTGGATEGRARVGQRRMIDKGLITVKGLSPGVNA